MLAKWLSIRQGPVKVAQRHRSEPYPKNPRLSSAEGWSPTSPCYYILLDIFKTMPITFASSEHTGVAYQSYHQYIRHSRQNITMISGPPSDFWCPLLSPSTSPNKPLQPALAIDWNPRRCRDIRVTLVTTMIKMPQRKASYHQFQRFVLHLRFHVDDPPRNSLWKWKPSPASAARKCGDVIHFTSTHSSGRAMLQGGWGDGNDRAMNKRSDWTDFVKEGAASDPCILLIGGACNQGFQRLLPQTKRQMEEGAVAILKGALTPHQSNAFPLCEMLR